jgi:hypothetical protein
LARKNYSHEKRMRELAKKNKKEEKLQRKASKGAPGTDGNPPAETPGAEDKSQPS